MATTIDFKGSPRDVGFADNSRKPAALARRDAGAADRDQGVKGEHAATYHASRRHENTSPQSLGA